MSWAKKNVLIDKKDYKHIKKCQREIIIIQGLNRICFENIWIFFFTFSFQWCMKDPRLGGKSDKLFEF